MRKLTAVDIVKSFAREWSDVIRMLAGAGGVAVLIHGYLLPLVIDEKPPITIHRVGTGYPSGMVRFRVPVTVEKNRDCHLQNATTYSALWAQTPPKGEYREYTGVVEALPRFNSIGRKKTVFFSFRYPTAYLHSYEGEIELVLDYLCDTKLVSVQVPTIYVPKTKIDRLKGL